MTSKELTKLSEIEKNLAKAGIDMEKELLADAEGGGVSSIPMIRILHQDNGKHQMYVDYGESYLDGDSQQKNVTNNKFIGVIFSYQAIRAHFRKGVKLPLCAAIDGRPTVDLPKAVSCDVCEFSKYELDRKLNSDETTGNENPGDKVDKSPCKPKIRLFMIAEDNGELKPFVFNLSPTSIKHWANKKDGHKAKLTKSGVAIISVWSEMFLMGVENESQQKWAEVKFDVDITNPVHVDVLNKAKKAREELRKLMAEISGMDYRDPGDQPDNDGGQPNKGGDDWSYPDAGNVPEGCL